MERFQDPAVWMEKRLAYTRSVATSSIGTAHRPQPLQALLTWSLSSSVGYIVGLGDRHINNILIDEQSAELIHIDLGS